MDSGLFYLCTLILSSVLHYYMHLEPIIVQEMFENIWMQFYDLILLDFDVMLNVNLIMDRCQFDYDAL